jgi:hypothetical protein
MIILDSVSHSNNRRLSMRVETNEESSLSHVCYVLEREVMSGMFLTDKFCARDVSFEEEKTPIHSQGRTTNWGLIRFLEDRILPAKNHTLPTKGFEQV